VRVRANDQLLTTGETTMTAATQTSNCKIRIVIVALTVGLATLVGLPGAGMALPKNPSKRCTCLCYAPNGEIGSNIYNNTAGVECSAYYGRACNFTSKETGLVLTGQTNGCADKVEAPLNQGKIAPGLAPTAPVLRRGIEGESAEPAPTTPTGPEEPSGMK
jgi:hypothetical protein